MKVVRHVSNIIIVSSVEACCTLHLSVGSSVERDIVVLLLRGFLEKFKEAPEKVRELSEKDFFLKKEEIWNGQLQKLKAELAANSAKLEDYELV